MQRKKMKIVVARFGYIHTMSNLAELFQGHSVSLVSFGLKSNQGQEIIKIVESLRLQVNDDRIRTPQTLNLFLEFVQSDTSDVGQYVLCLVSDWVWTYLMEWLLEAKQLPSLTVLALKEYDSGESGWRFGSVRIELTPEI